jgi:2-polyprenyl-3-methyl-5-hydroxy-6-metoxy-1,4-benzoquinol methylase
MKGCDTTQMHFDQFADRYKHTLDKSVKISGEESEYFAEYKARWLARLVTSDFLGTVLDFGCGVGLLAGFIKKQMPLAHIDGFDVSDESLAKVDPALKHQGTFTSDLARISAHYDLIVVANVMHHIDPADRQRTISNLAQRLKPSGRLAVFEHNPANPVTRWVVERCPFDRGVVLLPPSETKAHFFRAGLNVRRHDYIVFMPGFLAWARRLEPWLAAIPIGAQYVVIGDKHV